ncbi:MAG: type II toxin-antitoxin system HicA family toxin [Planctomycetes bacterium]|nr:type II toxin-antitoxin system HicA family toxin [Planctomycetota bacterium]
MPKLPRDLSYIDVERALKRPGFSYVHQRSHLVWARGSTRGSIPAHRRIKTGTLRAILREAGVTMDEFVGAL